MFSALQLGEDQVVDVVVALEFGVDRADRPYWGTEPLRRE